MGIVSSVTRRGWILGILCFLLAFVIAGITAWSFLQPPALSFAERLPADNTIAVFAHVSSPAVIDPYLIWFPVLTQIPHAAGMRSIALVRLSDGSTGWAIMKESMDAQPARQTDLITSSKEVDALLQGKEKRLSASLPFRSFSGEMSMQPWALIDGHAVHVPLPTTMDSVLLSALRSHPFILVTRSTGSADSWSIAFTTDDQTTFGGISFTTHVSSPLPSLLLVLTKPGIQFSSLLKALPAKERSVMPGLLGALAQNLLGPDVSIPYDFTPLIQEPFTLWLSSQGDGLRFLLEGRSNARTLAKSLGHLRESRKSRLPAATVLRKPADKEGFAIALLQSDPQALQEWHVSAGGWQADGWQETGGTGGIFTATRGSQFLLGNDRSWMEHRLANEGVDAKDALNIHPGSLHAAGVISLPFLRSFLQDRLAMSIDSGLLPSLETSRETYVWSVGQTGRIVKISVQRTGNNGQ